MYYLQLIGAIAEFNYPIEYQYQKCLKLFLRS